MSGIWLVHPSGNQNVRQAALAFAERGILSRFVTGVSWPTRSTVSSLLPMSVRAELERRSFPPIVEPFIRTYPWREATRLLAERLLGGHRASLAGLSANACHESLSRHVARGLGRASHRPSAIYAYDHCALDCFEAAHRLDVRRLYDLTAPYWRERAEIVAAAIERYPEWRGTADQIDVDDPAFQRKDAEIELAETIIVASRFTKRTLVRHRPHLEDRVAVVPYGAPPVGPARAPWPKSRRLRLLFAGRLTLAKGVATLADVAAKLGGLVDLTVVGSRPSTCASLDALLDRVRWIPSLPHGAMLSLMQQHDVLVFPSLFEGFGLVITEAMSQGCVVITTDRTIGGDIIDDGLNGVLVPPHSADAIVEAVLRLDGDRDLLAAMATAAQRWCDDNSWSVYREELGRVVGAVLAGDQMSATDLRRGAM